jgi:hypothetical protein
MAKPKQQNIIIAIVVVAILLFFAASIIMTKKAPCVGCDRDIHGCIGSAGYSWCEAKQKCLRIWEENCTTAKACTEEAKICPDGSAVGRTGPNCEFTPCPA